MAKQVKSKVNSMLIILFVIKGLFTEKSPLQVKQSITNTAVTFYGYCLNVRRLRSELWRQKNWQLLHGSAQSDISFSTRELLTKGNMTVALTHPTFLSSSIEGRNERLSF
jgi:hypothetical protein